MGVLVGLVFGLGLALIWASFVSPARERKNIPSRADQLLGRAGLAHIRASNLYTLCAALALVTGLLMLVVSQTWPIALAFAGMAGYLPFAVLSGRARKRQREFAEVWPEAVDNLASGVRAGLSLPEALAGLGERGPEPLRDAFTQFGLDYQVTGQFSGSLDRLKLRLSDPVGDRVVEGLRLAREVGGGELGRLLRNLSGFLRDDLRTRSELESRQAWSINGARLAVAAPWLVLLLLSLQGDVVRRYASAAGVIVLLIGGGLCLLAYRVMMRIGRLPTERRILT